MGLAIKESRMCWRTNSKRSKVISLSLWTLLSVTRVVSVGFKSVQLFQRSETLWHPPMDFYWATQRKMVTIYSSFLCGTVAAEVSLSIKRPAPGVFIKINQMDILYLCVDLCNHYAAFSLLCSLNTCEPQIFSLPGQTVFRLLLLRPGSSL